jgi:hypothetical protein
MPQEVFMRGHHVVLAGEIQELPILVEEQEIILEVCLLKNFRKFNKFGLRDIKFEVFSTDRWNIAEVVFAFY